jgi:hypothetical protein
MSGCCPCIRVVCGGSFTRQPGQDDIWLPVARITATAHKVSLGVVVGIDIYGEDRDESHSIPKFECLALHELLHRLGGWPEGHLMEALWTKSILAATKISATILLVLFFGRTISHDEPTSDTYPVDSKPESGGS